MNSTPTKTAAQNLRSKPDADLELKTIPGVREGSKFMILAVKEKARRQTEETMAKIGELTK